MILLAVELPWDHATRYRPVLPEAHTATLVSFAVWVPMERTDPTRAPAAEIRWP